MMLGDGTGVDASSSAGAAPECRRLDFFPFLERSAAGTCLDLLLARLVVVFVPRPSVSSC